MKGLNGQVAVVVGGGRGIGRGVAEKFAEYGAKVIIGSRTSLEVEQAVAAIRERGGEAHGFYVDVSHRERVREFVDAAWHTHQRINILVYCAGVNKRHSAKDYTEEDWQRVVDVNLNGAYRTCRAVGERMIAQGGGAIVTITSMMSHVVTPNQSAYAASKGALLQYTKLLAVEWARYNIRVNAVSPGYIHTDMTAGIMAQEAFRDAVLAKTPQGRFGTTEEIAEAVCFLASPAASFITGVCLPVDGGFLAGHPNIVPQA
jgi:NAD(P)-dependent dehydrogenase (short-subunit alcohol dehydrogenase family)